MDSDEGNELPEWADEPTIEDDATASADAYFGRQGEFMFNSNQINEFERDHAERRLHRPCPGCGRFPLGDQAPKEVYSCQQRERWEQSRCLACYIIWRCSLVVKRDVVRVSGDMIWFGGIEGDEGLNIRLYNEIGGNRLTTRVAGNRYDAVGQFGFARHIAPRADSDECLKRGRDWLMSCPRKETIKGTLLIGDEQGTSSKMAPLHFRESTVGDSGSIPRQIGYRTDALSSRGWCFQERLLAKRLLSFDSEQLIWECNSACHCESSDISNPDVSLSPDNNGDPSDHDYNMSIRLSGASKADIHEFWRIKVIQHYASRNLTRESDRLVAIQGIADVVREALNEEYIYGLWECDILEGLTWSTQASHSVGIPLDVAPTWSWASVYGRVSYTTWPARSWAAEIIGFTPLRDSQLSLHDNTPRLTIQLRSQLLVAQTTLFGSTNPVRLVPEQRSGLPVIEAYLDTACEAVFVEDSSGRVVKTGNRVAVKHPRPTSQTTQSTPAALDVGGPIQVWLLHLFGNKQQRYTMFLVLGLSKRSERCFERIGAASVTPKTTGENTIFEDFLEKQPLATVSII
ncbi:hypothetical protein O1611_g4193 [Lasiodiplodia mahajangana]|uniref:Uncharacterized protein n=1 Tax=Lasiodiplodia mahajangana TaxID=1108764 RepID=A0ACC2JPJ9_9PEZI|nr:hypothetical protein O1611_g4193 [Lasiodiplodia mahajangana]